MPHRREDDMANTVLVAYASRYGSTREVAETIAATLREHGLAVDIQPADETPTLEGYRAVALGAPLYIGHWHKDAQAFLTRHRTALAQQPVALFALGPLGTAEEELRGSRDQFARELAKQPWLVPVASEVFVGKYDPSTLALSHRLLAALPASPLHGLPASDNRDWAAIRAWADDLARQLQPAPVR
jgi:menaquinone-dependent protoporphyrinogen oxidase